MLTSHWTTWYRHRAWKRIRARQLREQPLCAFHLKDGVTLLATIVDHVEPHHGEPEKFWHGKLQSLCRECHELRKKFAEARGYIKDIGADGFPVDPQHPANLPRDQVQWFGFSIPHHLKAAAVPVTLVCGAPASGKTTWVEKHRKPGDTVISLDECKLKVGGRMWDTDREIWRRAIALRDSQLRKLASLTSGKVFVIVGAPTSRERVAWCKALGIEARDVVVLDTAADVCIARLRADPDRAHAVTDLTSGVRSWHHLFGTDPLKSSTEERILVTVSSARPASDVKERPVPQALPASVCLIG